jgi:L-alanine-DL-glutamate epimerase-like enolase superfamily enzyme
MRVSAIETVLHEDYPHVIHVLVHTDEGLVGLGESFHNSAAIAEYIHTVIAPVMLGEPATNVANMWQRLGHFCDGWQPWSGTISINSSATSAFDIAMWDLRAKALDLSLCDALGGPVRDSIRVYNTSADPGHLPPQGTPRHQRHHHEDWGIGGPRGGDYDDWTASLERPGRLATDLVEAGITAMKIYPFLRLLKETGGLYITPKQLDENLEPFREIRNAVGNAIDIAVDLNVAWTFGPALQICSALEEFNCIWLEDVLRISSIDSLAKLANVIRTPLAGYDYRAGLPAFADLINSGAVSIVRMDVQWVGGVSEVIRVANYAEARGIGVVLHDCTGPVQWATSIHCCLHLRNAMIQESVRAYYTNVYPTMIDSVPQVTDGRVRPLVGSGHGANLSQEYLDGSRRRSSTVRRGTFLTEALS